jgi:hypothetical protein
MACDAVEELEKDCENNVGGGTDFIYNDSDNVTDVTINASTHTVTAIDHVTAFQRVYFKRNNMKHDEEEQRDLNEGSNIIKSTCTLGLKRKDAAKSRKIKIMGQGQRDLDIIVKDGNGIYWYLPKHQLATHANTIGQTKVEGSKYDLTFVGEMEVTAYKVDPAVIALILAEPV